MTGFQKIILQALIPVTEVKIILDFRSTILAIAFLRAQL